MWCKGCRQDVPALRSGDMQPLRCPRCGEAVCADSNQTANVAVKPDEPSEYDGWELDQRLLHIQRALQGGKGANPDLRGNGDCSDSGPNENGTVPFAGFHAAGKASRKSETARREPVRFDEPQAGPPSRHVVTSNQSRMKRKKAVRRQRSVSGVFTWLVISLGAMSLACGGMLLIWSLAGGRPELWNIGLPPALIGQIVLLVGLVLQIDRLWYDSRQASAKLDDVDQQIHELTSTTMLLGANQNPVSATFYSHLAGGAAPRLLLTDLKSQLDLLAMRIAQDE
jgi:hypothetical protein